MAERSVTITLKLDTSDVITRSAEAAKALDAVGKRAKEAGDKLDQLNRKLDETGRSMGALGAKGVILNAVLGETQSRVKGVNDELGRTGPMTSAQTGLDKLKDSVKKTSDEQVKLGEKTKETGRQFTSAGSETGNLEVRLNAAKDRVKDLSAEFIRTNDDNTYNGLRKARAEVKSLEKDLDDAAKAAKALLPGGGKSGPGFFGLNPPGTGSRALSSIFNVSPELALGIGAAIAAGAPVISAALAGALGVGVGLSGIALGVVGQLENPMVRDAAKDVGEQIVATLRGATVGLAPNLASGLHEIGDAVTRFINGINFTELSAAIDQLSHGLAGFLDQLGPEFSKALHDSLPLMKEFARLLPEVGHALGDMVDHIVASHGAMSGLRVLMETVIGVLIAVGATIGGLSNAFQWLIESFHNVAGWVQNGAHAMSQFFDMLDSAGKHIAPLSRLWWGLAEALRGVAIAAGWVKEGFDFILHGDQSKKAADTAAAIGSMAPAAEDAASAIENLGNMFTKLPNAGDAQLNVTAAMKAIADSTIPAIAALSAYDDIAGIIANDSENAAQKTQDFGTLLGDIEHTAGTAADKNKALSDTFWSIADAELSAADKASLLSKAWDDLYGAGIKQNDLMEQSKKDLLEIQGSYTKNTKGVSTYQGALDAHSRSLDTNSLQGIHNIDVIKSAATHLHQLFLADVEETGSVEIATARDADRKRQLEKTAVQTGLNRDKTHALIEQYDRIPPGKNTQVTITGDQAVLRKMQELEAINIVLMDPGTSLATARRDVGIGGPGGHATGGPIVGPGSGTSDSILARLSAGEHVWTAREVQAAGGHQAVEWLRGMVLSPRVERPGDGSQGIAFNIPGFAAGGGINFGAPWHVIANVARTHIPPPLMDASGNWTGPIPGNVAGIQSWIRSQAGKPYGWAEAGPGAYDCCIVAGTRVHGPDGAKPIQDVRAGDRVYSYVDGKQESHVVTAAWQSIRQPVFKVRTRNRMVTASANHPFLRVVRTGTELFEHWEDAEWGGPIRVAHRNSAGITCSVSICTEPRWSNGMCRKHRQRWSQHGDPRITLSRRARFETQWARLDELGPGDMLVQPRRLETDTVLDPVLSDGTPVDDDVAWLIGAAVGDGTVTSDSLRLCLFGDKRDRAATIIASRWGGQPCYGDSFGLISSRSRLARALADLGLAVLGPDKRMPEAVWSWPEELQRAFLEGYCDADGYRPVNQKRHGGRTYSSASRELIEDVRALHISLGDPVSNICVNNRIKPITIKGVRVKNARNLHSFTVWPNNGHGEAKFRNNPGLAEWLDSGDFTLASVLSITPMGDAVTWDLEVEGAHNFIADGVVVHNSGIVSAVWNMLHGRSPYSHTFSTSDEAGFFPRSGYGMFTAGWANPGERGGGSVGHTAGSLAGLQFESTGSRGVHVDNVTPLSSFAHLGHYDNGGYLQPGWTAAYNGTGRPEEVRPQFIGGGTVTVIRHEHHIIIEGTGVLRGLRREIRAEGGNPLEVLGQ